MRPEALRFSWGQKHYTSNNRRVCVEIMSELFRHLFLF